jgi:hypothetical protein
MDLGFLHARRMSTGEESHDHNIQIEGDNTVSVKVNALNSCLETWSTVYMLSGRPLKRTFTSL